jgi:glycosyltransferase involved in cell wall biosynthesis
MHETTPRTAPVLTLSIVTYNSEKWLQAFFESLLKQDLPCDQIALCVLDNGSTDGSFAALQAQLSSPNSAWGHRFASVQLNQGLNIGFGAGHNHNLSLTDTPFFWVTNVDLEFEHDTLTTLLKTAQQDAAQSAAQAGSKVVAWECRQKPYEHPNDYHPVTGETTWCSSACVLFKTEALKAVKGYEPLLFLYGEDVELSYRLRDHGYTLRYVPSATVWHFTYEEAAQIKPQQFLGSTLANVLLRCRYGRRHEVIQGFVMFAGLFAMRPLFPGMRRKLLAQTLKLIQLAPHFLTTRRKSQEKFPFRIWDYELTREGAFYEYPVAAQSPIEQAKSSQPGLPVVSVLMRTMPGRSGKLREAMASVAQQTYAHMGGPIELVVVEDGGQGIESAKAALDTLRSSGVLAKVVYVPLPKSGRCIAGNKALEVATGQLCCFLDDDDLFYADHLEVLVGEWLQQPKLGAVYALGYEVRTHVLSEEPWVYENVMHSLIHRQAFSRPTLWHHNYFPIQTVLFQRRLYEEYGGFDLDLENLEDWNLWVRYSLKNDFKLVPKVTSLYRVPDQLDKAIERQAVLDDYYAKAKAKHDVLKVELTLPEIQQIVEEMSRQSQVAGVPTSWLKQMVLKTPGLRNLYHPLKKWVSVWRRIRR